MLVLCYYTSLKKTSIVIIGVGIAMAIIGISIVTLSTPDPKQISHKDTSPQVIIDEIVQTVPEKTQQQPSKPYIPPPAPKELSCDSSYPSVCIPPYPPDLDCAEIPHRNFRVIGSDPHGFDRDKDGIGCES